MPRHPQISSIPPVINCEEWEWTPFESNTHLSDNFWIGKDKQGNRWLTKLRGSFYAYREIVFTRMAQELGWSIQSSSFIKLDKHSANTLNKQEGEVHSAHWYMEEHQVGPCCFECPLEQLSQCSSIEDVSNSQVGHIRDLLKSEIAIYLFGANESCDKFFTPYCG